MCPLHHLAEAVCDGAVLDETPVVEDQNEVAVGTPPRLRLVDDQRPVKPAGILLPGSIVGVVPVGPRIRRDEIVGELLTGRDRRLREARHAIHRVVDPDAVPVHAGRLIEAVLDIAQMSSDTSAVDFAQLLKSNKTFEDALGPDSEFNVFERSRLFNIRKTMFDGMEALLGAESEPCVSAAQ